MTKKVLRPILPIAPDEYDSMYINQLARALDSLIDEVRSTNINFQGVSGSGVANFLEQGDLYIADGGFIKIVAVTDFFSGSVQGTASVGTVTVAVS